MLPLMVRLCFALSVFGYNIYTQSLLTIFQLYNPYINLSSCTLSFIWRNPTLMPSFTPPIPPRSRTQLVAARSRSTQSQRAVVVAVVVAVARATAADSSRALHFLARRRLGQSSRGRRFSFELGRSRARQWEENSPFDFHSSKL
jgi:hypothetical protein